MTERSEEIEDHLLKLGVGQNPIVWVGHSKGGLFVKQMLVDGEFLRYQADDAVAPLGGYRPSLKFLPLSASNSDDPALKSFLHQTKAMMFYSVPHRGSSLANLNLPLLRQSIELIEVKKGMIFSSIIQTHFYKSIK